jgi:hypothetical protein
LDDGGPAGDKAFQLRLSNPYQATLGTSSATVPIVDR